MTNQVNYKPQSTGYFDVVGNVAVTDKVFTMNQPGKNNENWLMNVFNPKVEGAEGQSMFMRFQDGFDKVKGKKIFAKSKENSNLEVGFADRFNENILKLVADMSFVKLAAAKEELTNDSGTKYKAWKFNQMLTVYDLIAELQKIMKVGETYKVRMTGRITWSEYRGEVQKNYELQTVYILTGNEEEGKEMPLGFKYTHNILLTSDSVDKSKLLSEGVATVKAKLYTTKKKVAKILPLTLMYRANENVKASSIEKVLDKYFTVTGDTVRNIKIEGRFNTGYVAGNVTEADLPADVLELIEDGIYSKEDILKKYAKRDRVDEMLIIRPVMDIKEGKAAVVMDDEQFTKDDLESAVEVDEVEETIIQEETPIADEDFMSEFEGL